MLLEFSKKVFLFLQIPEPFNLKFAKRKYAYDFDYNPMNAILLNEMNFYNILTNVMKTSLLKCRRGLRGIALLSENEEIIYNAVLNNKIPDFWRKTAFVSIKSLSGFILDLLDRISFIKVIYVME